MTFRPARMIRHPADGGPRMRMAVQDAWTAIRPARAIFQDWWVTLRTVIRVARRVLAARTASRRTAR